MNTPLLVSVFNDFTCDGFSSRCPVCFWHVGGKVVAKWFAHDADTHHCSPVYNQSANACWSAVSDSGLAGMGGSCSVVKRGSTTMWPGVRA